VVGASSLGTSGALRLAGSVAANTSTPIVNAGGIVNVASYSPVIAPGTFISIYGSYLGESAIAPSTPFLDLLSSTQVFLGGQPLPLYFTSSQQIDAIAPYSIAPGSTQQVVVQSGNALSQPQTVTVATAEPGVFTQNQSGSGPGAILGQSPGGIPAVNTPQNPAHVGDALLIYCTGLGAVSPPVSAGAAAPLAPFSYSGAITVTVGGKDAQVLFNGLAPGYVGLYQVNVIIPAGVSPGPGVPVILTSAGASGPPVTVVIE
jgi:uncharacterized protein (TIGR03437 family)